MAKEKKPEKPQDPNAWMVTFSDLMTLLLTFFVLLLTMKAMDKQAVNQMFSLFSGSVGVFGHGEKTMMTPSSVVPSTVLKIDAETLRKLLETTDFEEKSNSEELTVQGGGGELEEGKVGGSGGGGSGTGVGEKGGTLKRGGSLFEGEIYANMEEDLKDILDFTLGKESGEGADEKEKEELINKSGLKNIKVIRTTRGIVVRFPNEIMFASGSAKLQRAALPLFEKVGKFIIKKKYMAEIEGHTDNIPIHTRQFPSNWELSTTRAVNVLRYMTARFKIPPEKISALGFGETKPLFPNNTENRRQKNRRVEIVLYKSR